MTINVWGRETQNPLVVSADAGVQQGPAVADLGFAEFAVAWIDGTSVQLKFFDEQGNINPALPQVVVSDATSANIAELQLVGGGAGMGYGVAWSETNAGTSLLKLRYYNGVAGSVLGNEIAISANSAVAQHDLELSAYAKNDARGRPIVDGFDAVWVEGAAGPHSLGAIYVQRFAVPLDARRDPSAPPARAGIDGTVGTGSDTQLQIAANGRDPSIAGLHAHVGGLDETIVTFIDASNNINIQAYNNAGTLLNTITGVTQTNVNTAARPIAAGSQQHVVALQGGGFVVAWVSTSGGDAQLIGRVFTVGLAGGAWTAGPLIVLDTLDGASNSITDFKISTLETDGFSVSWTAADSGTQGIFSRTFTNGGIANEAAATVFHAPGDTTGLSTAGIIGDRYVAVYQHNANDGGDIGARILDSRFNDVGNAITINGPGITLVGDPDFATRGRVVPDILVGTVGQDNLDGRQSDDILDGGLGDDVIVAGLGNDTIDGGGGNDTLTLTGRYSVDGNATNDDYTIDYLGGGLFQFTDKRAVTVGDGIDFVRSVENFQFLGNAPGQQVLTLADLLGIPNTDVTPTAWGWTNEDTDNAPNADGTPDVDGFIVNSATTAGIQRNVSVSDSVGEFVAVAWEQAATPGADTHIRGQFFDVVLAPDGFMPNTMNLSDGVGIETNVAIASGGANSGWGFVFEQRDNAADTTRELRTNFMGPGQLTGPELSVLAEANVDQHDAAIFGSMLDRTLQSPVGGSVLPTGMNEGYNVAWVSTHTDGVDGVLDAGYGRIMLQRFEAVLDPLGNPGAPVAGGIDGIVGLDNVYGTGDAAVWVGDEDANGVGGIFGRNPSTSALHTFETGIVWVAKDGAGEKVMFRAYDDLGQVINYPAGDNMSVGFPVAAGTNAHIVSAGAVNFGIVWITADATSPSGYTVMGTMLSSAGAGLDGVGFGFGAPSAPFVLTQLPAGFDPANSDFQASGLSGEDSNDLALSWTVTVAGQGTNMQAQHVATVLDPVTGIALNMHTAGDIVTVNATTAGNQSGGGIAGLLGDRFVAVFEDNNPTYTDGADLVARVIDTRDAVNPVPIVGDLIQAGGRVQARRDVIVGTNGNDNILADISNSDGLVDWIFAGMGDDIVQGGPGVKGAAGIPEIIDGGEGIDTAVYTGRLQDYSITPNGDGSVEVIDLRPTQGANNVQLTHDGIDNLYGFENIQFLDLSNGGASAQTITFGFPGQPPALNPNYDGTPVAWSLDDTSIFKEIPVDTDPTPADTANRPDGINVTNLQDGAGLVWTKNGNQVWAIAYDTTGKPDPILLGANTQLTSSAFSTNVVRDIDVAMTGGLGMTAVWESALPAPAGVIAAATTARNAALTTYNSAVTASNNADAAAAAAQATANLTDATALLAAAAAAQTIANATNAPALQATAAAAQTLADATNAPALQSAADAAAATAALTDATALQAAATAAQTTAELTDATALQAVATAAAATANATDAAALAAAATAAADAAARTDATALQAAAAGAQTVADATDATALLAAATASQAIADATDATALSAAAATAATTAGLTDAAALQTAAGVAQDIADLTDAVALQVIADAAIAAAGGDIPALQAAATGTAATANLTDAAALATVAADAQTLADATNAATLATAAADAQTLADTTDAGLLATAAADAQTLADATDAGLLATAAADAQTLADATDAGLLATAAADALTLANATDAGLLATAAADAQTLADATDAGLLATAAADAQTLADATDAGLLATAAADAQTLANATDAGLLATAAAGAQTLADATDAGVLATAAADAQTLADATDAVALQAHATELADANDPGAAAAQAAADQAAADDAAAVAAQTAAANAAADDAAAAAAQAAAAQAVADDAAAVAAQAAATQAAADDAAAVAAQAAATQAAADDAAAVATQAAATQAAADDAAAATAQAAATQAAADDAAAVAAQAAATQAAADDAAAVAAQAAATQAAADDAAAVVAQAAATQAATDDAAAVAAQAAATQAAADDAAAVAAQAAATQAAADDAAAVVAQAAATQAAADDAAAAAAQAAATQAAADDAAVVAAQAAATQAAADDAAVVAAQVAATQAAADDAAAAAAQAAATQAAADDAAAVAAQAAATQAAADDAAAAAAQLALDTALADNAAAVAAQAAADQAVADDAAAAAAQAAATQASADDAAAVAAASAAAQALAVDAAAAADQAAAAQAAADDAAAASAQAAAQAAIDADTAAANAATAATQAAADDAAASAAQAAATHAAADDAAAASAQSAANQAAADDAAAATAQAAASQAAADDAAAAAAQAAAAQAVADDAAAAAAQTAANDAVAADNAAAAAAATAAAAAAAEANALTALISAETALHIAANGDSAIHLAFASTNTHVVLDTAGGVPGPGLPGGEIVVVGTAGAGIAVDPVIQGYEVVDVNNDTLEVGFNVGFVLQDDNALDALGGDNYGALMLARYEIPVYDILVDGAGAPILDANGQGQLARDAFGNLIPSTTATFGVGSETGPISLGLDGLRGTADDSAAIAVTDLGLFAANAIPVGAHVIQGRDMTMGSLHDGQLVVSYVGTDERVHLKIYLPTINEAGDREMGGVGADVVAQGITTYSEFTVPFPTTLGAVAPGSTAMTVAQQNGSFGVFWGEANGTGGLNVKGVIYSGAGSNWSPSAVMTFATNLPALSSFQVASSGVTPGGLEDGFFVSWESAGAGVQGQRYNMAGETVGQQIVVGDPGTGTPTLHSTTGIDDGRMLVGYVDGTNVSAQFLDNRQPGIALIGPRTGAPADVIVGTVGDDAIDGRALNDQLFGGLGNDFITMGSGSDQGFGGDGNDTILGGTGQDQLFGEAGDDLLWGGLSGPIEPQVDRDLVTGLIAAGVSAALIATDPGADIISGGAGIDTISYQGEFGDFNVNLATGIVTSDRDLNGSFILEDVIGALVDDGAGGTIFQFSNDIENATGGIGNDTLTGDNGANILTGGGGNDSLSGGNGADTLLGGVGNDVLNGDNGADLLDGGDGDDVLNGGAAGDTLTGGLGNDALAGGDGSDSLDGGDGFDRAIFTGVLGSYALSIVSGNLTIRDTVGAGGTDTVRNIEVFRFSNGAGGTVDYTLAQILQIQAPATGTPTLSDTTPTEGDLLSVNTTTIADLNGLGAFSYQWQRSANGTTNWTNISGATAATLTVPDAAGTALGALANQFLRVVVSFTDGLGHAESLTSASTIRPVGANYDASASGASVTFNGTAGDNVIVGSNFGDVLRGNAGNDDINGADGNDNLFGDQGDDVITGGNGNDTLTGGAGNDTAVFTGPVTNYALSANSTTFNVADVAGGTGTDTVFNFETLRIGGIDYAIRLGTTNADTVNGGAGSQVIFGLQGADTLNGDDGSDLLSGGGGNDTVNGGNGDDFIFQGSTDGRDLIDGGAGADTYILTGVAGAETFTIMTRAEALIAGISNAQLAANTEIVITRNGTGFSNIVAQLDNIEEIKINTLLTTANNGNGVVDGGAAQGDTVVVRGNFDAPFTSLAYSTIRVEGSNANDTIDISGLSSAHRVVFDTNGGADTFIGSTRAQDIVDGISRLGPDTLPLGSGIESDFDLTQLMASNNPYGAGGDHNLQMQTELTLVPNDFALPGSPLGVLHDPLAGVSVDVHKIMADYLLLAV